MKYNDKVNAGEKRLEDAYDYFASTLPMKEKSRRKEKYERKLSEKQERLSKKKLFQFD